MPNSLHVIRIFLLSIILLIPNAHGSITFTKQIVIPEHPHAFNPSIVAWGDYYLLSFREIIATEDCVDDPIHCAGWSQIGVVLLDKAFNPVCDAQILSLYDECTLYSRAEDARLLYIDGVLHIIYSDNRDAVATTGGFRMYVARLDFNGDKFIVHNTECLKDFEGARAWRREKNWVPFDYEGSLLLAYSLTPHRIFNLQGDGSCETVSCSPGNPSWAWGELRGGTPALADGDGYLAFFHSTINTTDTRNGEVIAHYFMGAYVFEKEPPFRVVQVSTEPLIHETFYAEPFYEPYWKPVRVVFPCGLLIEEDEILLTYGRQDHECWVARLNKQELLQSLTNVP